MRIYQDGVCSNVGTTVSKECWNIAKYKGFTKKFKIFLRLLKTVKPTLFEYWTNEDLENLLKKCEVLARE